jgi:hypothetical protein
LLSKESTRLHLKNQKMGLLNKKQENQNKVYPPEPKMHHNLYEHNQINNSPNLRFPDPNHPMNPNLFNNYPNPHYVNSIMSRGPEHFGYPMDVPGYPPINQQSERIHYAHPYPPQYGTERYDYNPNMGPGYMNSRYMSQKMRPSEHGGFPKVPRNSMMMNQNYQDPQARFGGGGHQSRPDHLTREDRFNTQRNFRARGESPRHFPDKKEYKPSDRWKKKERRLSREKNPVDSDLINIINKYKYSGRRKKY